MSSTKWQKIKDLKEGWTYLASVSVLKKKEIYTTTNYTFEEIKTALFEYIEPFYNRKRRHSALGYKTPQQVEEEPLAA